MRTGKWSPSVSLESPRWNSCPSGKAILALGLDFPPNEATVVLWHRPRTILRLRISALTGSGTGSPRLMVKVRY